MTIIIRCRYCPGQTCDFVGDFRINGKDHNPPTCPPEIRGTLGPEHREREFPIGRLEL